MPPTHFLRIAGQSAREVADDGSTEGGITESLAMMNGEVMEELMTDSLAMKLAQRKQPINQISCSISASREPLDTETQQCLRAFSQEIELGDILWALLNSREFMFIQ